MSATVTFAQEVKNANAKGRTINRTFFQSKLSINAPGDEYEQEADAMADKVMRMSNTSYQNTFFSPTQPFVQRKCDACEEEDKTEHIQRKAQNISEVNASNHVENYISSLSGNGKNLSQGERSFFEPKMGYDFSNVKIHADSKANGSAKSLNALAYTHGNNIVFGNNQYQPGTNEGKKLLAHELTHVVQQNSNLQTKSIQRQEGKDPSTLSDEELNTEYKAVKEYIDTLDPVSQGEERESYFNQYYALEAELRKRCIKDAPSQPTDVSQKLIDRITGKYASIDGDPGEGMIPTPYVAAEGQCTIGYGHVIYPKNLCTIVTEEPPAETTAGDTKKAKPKKSCVCQPPFNSISKVQATAFLKSDIKTQVKEVQSKIKVDLNQQEFDAMADLALHVGSLPADFVSFVHAHWCTDKDAVHERYLKTAITMKNPDTKKWVVMKNFVERRKKRSW
ncbi:MAG: hypothetical protein JWQ09_3797 [Segetibacter sp.]|nr:hypothetical protein [Segetibacter sp.]